MTERKKNVTGTMRLRRGAQLGGCTVVVIDDVRTTGATMTEACRAVVRGLKDRETPAQAVWAAVLGVAVEKPRDSAVPAKAAEPS
jgi:hypoxanthine phosphoribosyltransferase